MTERSVTAERLRRSLVTDAEHSRAIARDSTVDGKVRSPHATSGAYAYNLAGLIRWIGQEFGADAEHRAARLMNDSLMNGDRDLNGDLGIPRWT